MFNKDKVKLGIAPIGWTNDDMPALGGENTFEQCVSEMALAGFTGSEVGNKYPKDTAVLKEALDLRKALLQGRKKTTCWQFSYREGQVLPLIPSCPLDTCCLLHFL